VWCWLTTLRALTGGSGAPKRPDVFPEMSLPKSLADSRRYSAFDHWTLRLWLYVSVTGVVVYWMLYRLYPQGRRARPGLVRQTRRSDYNR